MKVRKLLSLCLLVGVLLFPSCAAGMEPHEVLTKTGTRVGSFQCQPEKIATVIQSEDKKWMVLLLPKTGKIIMIEKDAEGNDVRVIFGKVWLAGRELKLEVELTLSAEEASKKFPNPCDYLAPLEA